MNLDVSRSREYACKLVYLKERKREKLALASFRVLHKCSKIFRLDTETRYPSSFSHILIPWQNAQTSFQDTLWSFNFPQSSYSCSEFRPRWHSTRVARLLLGNVIQLNRSSTSVLYLMPFVHKVKVLCLNLFLRCHRLLSLNFLALIDCFSCQISASATTMGHAY